MVIKMEKNNILDVAKELGKLVSESEILVNYVNAKEAYDNDNELHNIIREYTVQQKALENLAADESSNETLEKCIRDRIQVLYDKANESETMKKFDEAEADLNDILASINNIIRESIFERYPELRPAPSSCSGNCASCGGCH
ncbi:MAG: YlbF family regulator [Ruminococcaceae bacterium]|nr:YlbF family regulator [Oscillospiraceae bacterium]